MSSSFAEPSQPRIIGLTGGMGAGKSTVAKMLTELGAQVIDADAISRSLTAVNGLAIPLVQAQFGAEFIDANNAMNRAKMRDWVFAHPAAKAQLEAILHPMIHEQVWQQVQAVRAQKPSQTVVLDVPLLTESPHFLRWRAKLDSVWVVHCSRERQIARVQARSGLSRAQIEAVLNAQAHAPARLAIADVLLRNEDDSLEALRLQVNQHWQQCQEP